MLLCPTSVTEIMTVETTVMNLDVVSMHRTFHIIYGTFYGKMGLVE